MFISKMFTRTARMYSDEIPLVERQSMIIRNFLFRNVL